MSSDSLHPLSMPFHEWPPADQAAWKEACQPDLFALSPCPLTKWSSVQQKTASKHYGLWLRYLEINSPELLAHNPGQRPTRHNMCAFLDNRRHSVSATSLSKYTCDIYGIMLSLEPERDWAWLKELRRFVGGYAQQQPLKSRPLTLAGTLLQVGDHLITVSFNGTDTVQDQIAFRDGLIIIMLILIPVRITQFSIIQIDRHLIQDDQGQWIVRWSAEETKTRREAIHPIPPELVELLQLYLSEVRPTLRRNYKTLSATDDSALWIGISGKSIGSQVIRRIIESRTLDAIGYKVNPHAFRASAASTYAIEAPEHAREAPALLDHRSLRTTEQYYLLGQRAKNLKRLQVALSKAAKTCGC